MSNNTIYEISDNEEDQYDSDIDDKYEIKNGVVVEKTELYVDTEFTNSENESDNDKLS